MCCPPVLFCFVILVLPALSAPTNRTRDSDSSSISITEDPENEDVELRTLGLEKSTEFTKILKNIISYMSVHFTESGQLSDLKCEIRTREMHTNFVYHNLKGKLFPKRKTIYTSSIQPALGIRKYYEITPDKFKQRIYFFNTTQQLFIKNDKERDDNNLLKEKQNIDTDVPEANQRKNITKSETLFPKYKTTEEIDSVAGAITVTGQSYDENNKNKTGPQHYYAEKRENTTKNLTSTFNSQSGTFNITITENNGVNQKFTSTTLKPSMTFSHQRSNTDENIIVNLNSLESTESSVYSNLHFTKNNVPTSSKRISHISGVESTTPVQQNNTNYKSNIPKNHITNVSDEERSMEENYSASAKTKLDTLTSTEKENSYSIYYDDRKGTSSSLPTVSNDGSKRFKQEDSFHTDLATISRYTLGDLETSTEITTPVETKDFSNGVTKSLGATIYNTLPSKFGFIHNRTIIESMLRGLDRDTTSSQYYKQSLNSKELSSTTAQVSTESIPLHSESYDFKTHYYNMASSFYPDIYNYSTSTDLPSVTTQLESNFSMVETENVTHEGQGPENVTDQNRSSDSIDVTMRSTLPSQNHEFLNRVSSSIQMKKNATLSTRRIYVTDDLKSEGITQNNTYSTSQIFADFKETTDKKEINIPEHNVKQRTTDVYAVNTEPSTSSDYQYKSTYNVKSSLSDTTVPEYSLVHTNDISSTRDLIYTLASQTSPKPSENMHTQIYDKPVTEETVSTEININPSSAMTNIHSIEISVNPTELGENSENTTNVKLLQHSNGNLPITAIVESNVTEVFSGESQVTDIYHTVPSQVSNHDINKYTRYSKLENKTAFLNIINLVTNKNIPFTSTTALKTDQTGTYNMITESELGTNTNSVDTYNKSAALNATDTLLNFNTVTNLKQFNQVIHNSTTPFFSKYLRGENYSKVYPYTKDTPYSIDESSPLTKPYNLTLNDRSTISYYYKDSDNFTDETLTSTKSLNESYSQQDITPETFTTLEIRKYVLNSSTYDFGNNESEVIHEENSVNKSTLNTLDVGETFIIKEDVTSQDISKYSLSETTMITNYQSNSKFNISHYSNKRTIPALELKSTTDYSLETTAYTLPSLANIYETENKSLTTSSKLKTTPMSSIRPATSVITEIDDISQTDAIKKYSPVNDYMQNSITTNVINDSTENDSFSNKNDMPSSKVYVKNEIMSPCTSYTKDQSQLIYNATTYATNSISLLTQPEILPHSSSSTMLNTISTTTDKVKNKTGLTTSVTLEEEISSNNGGTNSENVSDGMSTTILNLYSTFLQYNYTLLPTVTSLVDKTRYDFSEHPVHNISTPVTLKFNDDINIDHSTLKSVDNIEKNATEKLIDVMFTSNFSDWAGSLSTPSSLSTPQNSNTIKFISPVTNVSFDSHFNQSSGEEYGESTPFSYQLENKTENTDETNSYTDSPVDINTNPYSETVDGHVSMTYPNAMNSIENTSTNKYNNKITDIINLTTAKINRSSFDANASANNNYLSSTPRSISTTENTSKTDLTMAITGGAYKSTIHKYSEAKSSLVTLNDVTEIEPEDTSKAETHTRKNEFIDFSTDVSDLITTEVDIDMHYSTPNIMNYMETTSSLEEQSSKEKSSTTTTGDNHGENQTEKTHYVETNTQRNEYSYSGPEEISSGILVDKENEEHKTANFQNTTEKTTDIHNEKLGNLSNILAIKTIGSSVNGLVTTAKTFNENNTVSTPVSMYQKATTSKNVSNVTATEPINTNKPIDSKTEVTYHDEINTQFYETTPFLNTFTFFLPTTDLVTNYLPVRIHPLMAFSEIK